MTRLTELWKKEVRRKYREENGLGEEDEIDEDEIGCIICLDMENEGQMKKQLKCGHEFHWGRRL